MPGFSDVQTFLYGQLFQTPAVPSTSFAGRTVVLTGANGGLGLEAAKHYVRLNVSHLILGCRDVSKGEKVKELLLSSCPLDKPPTIEVWQIDMSSYSSVLAFGDRTCTALSRLDAFVANAGVIAKDFELAEGYESTVTVNVISTFLLAMLVVPKLRDSANAHNTESRLTIVGSMGHVFADYSQLSNPPLGEIFKSMNEPIPANDLHPRYQLSKLMVTLLCISLAEATTKAGTTSVIVNDVNPGWCKTELFRHDNSLEAIPKFMLGVVGRTSEAGSRTLVHAAAAGRESHGRYLSECQVKPTLLWVQSQEGRDVTKRLWDELTAIVEMIRPGVTKHF